MLLQSTVSMQLFVSFYDSYYSSNYYLPPQTYDYDLSISIDLTCQAPCQPAPASCCGTVRGMLAAPSPAQAQI